MAYMAVSAALGNRAWFPWPSGKLFPNIYLLMLADSAAYKSTAINMIRDVINEVDEEIETPSDCTSASLARIIEKYKQGFIPVDEFSIVMKAEDGHFSTVKNMLTSVYDSPKTYRLPYRVQENDGDKKVVKYPVFSMAAATTPDTFLKDASLEDLKGGFLSRFIVVSGKDSDKCISTPPGVDHCLITSFAATLRQLRNPAFFNPELPMEMEADAYQIRDDWYKQIRHLLKTDPEYKEMSNAVNRSRTYALKFAMLHSVIEGHEHRILAEDILEGINIANAGIENLFNSMSNLEMNVSTDKWVKAISKAREILKGHGHENPANRTVLYQSIRHISKPEMDKVISTLIDRREIKVDIGPNGQQYIVWTGR